MFFGLCRVPTLDQGSSLLFWLEWCQKVYCAERNKIFLRRFTHNLRSPSLTGTGSTRDDTRTTSGFFVLTESCSSSEQTCCSSEGVRQAVATPGNVRCSSASRRDAGVAAAGTVASSFGKSLFSDEQRKKNDVSAAQWRLVGSSHGHGGGFGVFDHAE